MDDLDRAETAPQVAGGECNFGSAVGQGICAVVVECLEKTEYFRVCQVVRRLKYQFQPTLKSSGTGTSIFSATDDLYISKKICPQRSGQEEIRIFCTGLGLINLNITYYMYPIKSSYGDIDPRTLTVGGRSTTRQDWRRGQGGYFKTGHGTSLWDKRGVFGTHNWHYFLLPEGTIIPDSLKLVEGNWSDRYQATHWQIEVANGGELRADGLKGALDNLARNCVVRAVELGISLA